MYALKRFGGLTLGNKALALASLELWVQHSWEFEYSTVMVLSLA